MLRRFVFIGLLLISLGVNAQKEVFKNEEVTVSVLKDKTWVFETWDKTTMYLLEGEKRAALIDTGTRCAGLDKIVRGITDKPLDVIVTHAHPDHAGCVEYFDQIWLHPADTVLYFRGLDKYKGEISFMEEGKVFDLGGRKLEVAHMPGHTPGSVVLLDKANGDCYSGDAFGSGEVWLQCIPTSPISEYYASCNKMEKIMKEEGIRNIWCGHYPYLKRALTVEYIGTMKRIVVRLMKGDQAGAVPYPHPTVKMEPTVRRLSEGYCCIVYDSKDIKEPVSSTDDRPLSLVRFPGMEPSVYFYRDTVKTVDGRFAGVSPLFVVYPDKVCANEDEAAAFVTELGLNGYVRRYSSSVCVMTPANGKSYDNEADLEVYKTLHNRMRVISNMKVIGVGDGATFVNRVVAAHAGAVAGIATIGGKAASLPEGVDPVPAYVAGKGNKQVAAAYIKANRAELSVREKSIVRYANPEEPLQQVVVGSDKKSNLKAYMDEAWEQLLSRNYRLNNYKHTWYTGCSFDEYGPGELESYILPEKWGITRKTVIQDITGTGDYLWYEYLPSSMQAAAAGTVPLVLLLHGNNNDPRTQAETSGFIELCAEENFMVAELEWQGNGYARMGLDGIEQVVYHLLRTYPQLDPSRVYAEGLSAGSATATGLGIRKSHVFAAVGAQSAGIIPNRYSFGYNKEALMNEALQKRGAVEIAYFGVTGKYDDAVPYLTAENWQDNSFFNAWRAYQTINNLDVSECPDFEKDSTFGIALRNRTTLRAKQRYTMEVGELHNSAGIPLLKLVTINEYGHWNFKPDARMMWEYFRQFSRDPQTKRLRYCAEN